MQKISVYLEGQDPTEPPPPSSTTATTTTDTDTDGNGSDGTDTDHAKPAAAVAEKVARDASVPVAEAVAEAGATIEEMQALAIDDPTALGGFIRAPNVGAFERAESGQAAVPSLAAAADAAAAAAAAATASAAETAENGAGDGVSPPRRGSIPVSRDAVPSVVMAESIMSASVAHHMETSYYDAIQQAFAEIMKAQEEEGKGKEEEERA